MKPHPCLRKLAIGLFLPFLILGFFVPGTALAGRQVWMSRPVQIDIPGPIGQDNANWELTFHDEFDGPAVDRAKWNTYYRYDRHGELQAYVEDDSHNNYVVQNGILSLIARNEYHDGKNYTSGVLNTQERFAQAYGYFEIHARMPYGKGFWPCFWLLPNPTGWPPEIDVMEYLGHQPNVVYMSLHFTGGADTSYFNGPDFSTGWHTFGVKWEPEAIIWYVDGVERKRFTDASRIPTVPMYLITTLAVGGDWPGPPDASTVFPASFDIDYIRVYKQVTPAPTPPPTPNPTYTHLIFLPVVNTIGPLGDF